MDFPHDLVLDLNRLTAVLDQRGTDLQSTIAVLIADLRAAVPSFLGLTMALTDDQSGVVLNLLPPALAERTNTSVMIPLGAVNPTGPEGTVVFYAANPGAFVDLAADCRFGYGLNGEVVLDEHLPSEDRPAQPSGVVGLAGASIVNQAIGALIHRGHTPEQAHGVLRRHAARDGVALHRAAEQLLHAVRREHHHMVLKG